MICRKYSFQTASLFAQINNMLDAPASNTDGFLLRDTCLSSTWLNRSICNKMRLCPAWKLSLRTYSFQKTNSILQVNNVLDTAASKINGYLSRDTCVSSTHMKRSFGGIRPFLHHEIPKLQQVLVSWTSSLLTGIQYAWCSCIYHRWFSSRDACVSSTHLNMLSWNKMSLPPPWKLRFSRSITS
jgi:hypothetical protein